MNKCEVMFMALLLIINTECRGDSCPSADKVRSHKLPQKYEWTVDEHTTLQNLLSVKKLYAVRIMDQGAYVSCHYTTDKWPVKLDVAPSSGACKTVSHDGKWKDTDSGQVVCLEKDVSKCTFSFECKKEH